MHRLVAPALALALTACGDSDKKVSDAALDIAFPDAGDTSEVSSSVTFISLCDGFARACCNVERCVEPGASDQDGCFVATRDYCEDVVRGPVESQISPGAVTFSESAASQCFAYYLAGLCGDSTEFETPPAACDAILQGTVGEGGACDFDLMCRGDLFCKPVAGQCPGTCAPRVALGGACNGIDALCARDLVCSDDDGGTCLAVSVPAGGACVLTRQCPPEQHCADGTCVADKVAGQACPSGFECAVGFTCDFGLDPPSCRKIPTLDETCDRFCAYSLLFHQAAIKCVPPPEVGDACTTASAPCGYHGLECNAATDRCELRGGVGSACGGPDGDLNCTSAWCDGDFTTAGTCQPYKGLGDACEGFGQCGTRLTCRDGTCQARAHPCRGVTTFRCF